VDYILYICSVGISFPPPKKKIINRIKNIENFPVMIQLNESPLTLLVKKHIFFGYLKILINTLKKLQEEQKSSKQLGV